MNSRGTYAEDEYGPPYYLTALMGTRLLKIVLYPIL